MSEISFHSFFLENGLKVLVHEDHSIPKAVVNIIYRVGAKNEDPERTGFAHLFEHLMFGGSKNIVDYDTPLQRVGGENNAFTNSDVTNYYLTLPGNQLETAFWLESDRMLELDFSQKSLEVQKSVVIEEFKQRYLNHPYGDAHLVLRAEHFKVHPYHWPTIGKDISHIEGASLEEVKAFFYGFYAPNNATLVVGGDVTLNEVERLAKKWFGPIPHRELKHKALPVEPPQTAPRSLTMRREVPFPAVYKMYHIPAKTDSEYFVADFLTDLLSGGKASRLYQTLVKDKNLATSVHAFSWGAHDPGIISVDATLAKGVSPETYEDALTEIFEDLQNVEDDEVQRMKNAIETHFVMDRQTVLNRVISLALCDALGDPNLANTSLKAYLKITTEDVKAAAQKILSPNNCSTLYYLPLHEQ